MRMTVILGASTTVSGSGTWTYPDVGLVIGLVLEVPDPGSMGRFYGTEILRAQNLGVYAPISEAGRLIGRPVFNDQFVTYDIGKAPIGLAYDLADALSLSVTEILSETPPTGGGGPSSMTSAQYLYTSNVTVVDSTLTPVPCTILNWNTDTSNYSIDGDDHLSVATAGIYRLSYHVRFSSNTPTPIGRVMYSVNFGPQNAQAAIADETATGDGYAANYVEVQLASGDAVGIVALNESGADQQVDYADLTLSTG